MRPGWVDGHPNISGNEALERKISVEIYSTFLNQVYVLSRGCLKLTMQAACTASLRLAALGSHQNMWQVKSLGPSAMMKAKVWTSFPTPIKDRKRTLHSDSTSSSWGQKRIKNTHTD